MRTFRVSPACGRDEFTTSPSFNPNNREPTELSVNDVREKFDEMLASSPTAKPAGPLSNPAGSVGEELAQMQAEIEQLKIAVDIWKDRCMAAEQAHDATIEHYEQLTNREW